MPLLTQTTSPGTSSRVSSPMVIVTRPSMTAISCSVCSWACRETCLPGSYCTRHSSTWSPPIAWSRTPSTNSNASTPFQVPNPDSGIDAPEGPAAVGAERGDGDLLVVDYALALATRLALLAQRPQHALGRGRHLGDPHADGVVDRGRDRRWLLVVGHLADRLGAERPVHGRVLEDHVLHLRQVRERGRQVGAELLSAVLGRRVVGVRLLEQTEPEAHHRAALDLPLDERGVDRPADVVDLQQ